MKWQTELTFSCLSTWIVQLKFGNWPIQPLRTAFSELPIKILNWESCEILGKILLREAAQRKINSWCLVSQGLQCTFKFQKCTFTTPQGSFSQNSLFFSESRMSYILWQRSFVVHFAKHEKGLRLCYRRFCTVNWSFENRPIRPSRSAFPHLPIIFLNR